MSPRTDKVMDQFELVIRTAEKLKKVMVEKSLTAARAKCPVCQEENLHGQRIVGQAAGRHRKSGGAFRMWCSKCPDVRMME